MRKFLPRMVRQKSMRAIALLMLLGLRVVYAHDNLELGIPGKADQIIDREGYALGYSKVWKEPRWVTYRLTSDEVTKRVVGRSNEFMPDPEIKNGPQLEDYRGSGYDRGHMAPAADMKWSAKAMLECFYLSNMCPQDRSNNAGIWNEIENTVRGFECSEGSVFVVTGPVVGEKPLTIGRNKVAVPDGFYKVVYDETPPEKMIAFHVPNKPMPGKPQDYACSVAKIEEMTGLDFFSKLSAGNQARLEAECIISDWNWSKSQKARAQGERNAPVNPPAAGIEEYFAGK